MATDSNLALGDPLTRLTGLGPKMADCYRRLEITTLADLINHLPRRYDDFATITRIDQIKDFGPLTVAGTVTNLTNRYIASARFRGHLTEGLVTDGSGSLRVVWYQQPFRVRQFKTGLRYYLSGDYKMANRRLVLSNPNAEIISQQPVQTARLRPVYPTTAGLANHQIRKHLSQLRPLVAAVPEILPGILLEPLDLMPYSRLLTWLHFPEDNHQKDQAQKQFGIRQMLTIHLSSRLLEEPVFNDQLEPLRFDPAYLKELIRRLPFELTASQTETVTAISADLARAVKPIDYLIQGDVGSGKTVVAGLIVALLIAAGKQVALLAPTEILVAQHLATFRQVLPDLADSLASLTAKASPARKKQFYQDLQANKIKLAIGTHSLLNPKLAFADLGLAIIDEQHRFGVNQRQQLRQKTKTGHQPHCLSLSATPIPRSLQLIVYNNLKVYPLTEKPPGRVRVVTRIVAGPDRPRLLARLLQEADCQHQLYIVCPAIDSDQVTDPLQEAVEMVKAHLAEDQFLVVHGRLKPELRLSRLEQFRAGVKPVMITTTVIESGIDVANATTMLILSPERFGLAQLHQLRGRIGRGQKSSHCYLALADDSRPTARLKAILKHDDGFILSELDLKLRGPGVIYGTRQSGRFDLGYAPLTDQRLLVKIRQVADDFIAASRSDRIKLQDYPRFRAQLKHNQAIVSL